MTFDEMVVLHRVDVTGDLQVDNLDPDYPQVDIPWSWYKSAGRWNVRCLASSVSVGFTGYLRVDVLGPDYSQIDIMWSWYKSAGRWNVRCLACSASRVISKSTFWVRTIHKLTVCGRGANPQEDGTYSHLKGGFIAIVKLCRGEDS